MTETATSTVLDDQDLEGADRTSFHLDSAFQAAEVSGGLALGPLETEYEDLFAEALEDGIITAEERDRLDKAADNLGLDKDRLRRLEQAMMAAYEARHRVRVVERFQDPAASLAPLIPSPAPESSDGAQVKALKSEVTRLNARIAELEEALRQAQAAINVEVDLSELESAAVDASEDPDEQWKRVRRDPLDVEAVRALHKIYVAREQTDAAWCTAQALAVLGAAKDDEKQLYEEHRPVGLMTPQSGISPNTWHDCLFHPEEEALTGQIFAMIAPAVLLGRVTTLRRDGTLHQPTAATKQDVGSATLMSVKALGWGAAILGLPVPPVYVEKDRDVAFEHIPAVPPLTVIGSRALRGASPTELAFLAGRHLSGYRGEHFVKTLFSAVPDLEDLFLAALVIGHKGVPISAGVKQRVEPIARAIEPLLEPPQLDAMRGYFLRFVEEGGRTNLQRWSAAVDKTQCRVGLALSHDLSAAMALLEREEGERGPLTQDLIAFATSTRYLRLRRQLGLAIE